MAHRDDLEAARARIEALEQDLAEARDTQGSSATESEARLREELRRARARIRELEDLLRASERQYETARSAKYELQARVAELEKELAEKQKPPPSRPRARPKGPWYAVNAKHLAPASRYNEQYEPLLPSSSAKRAGVLCDECASRDKSVEMLSIPTFDVPDVGIRMVVCPCCGHTQAKRMTPDELERARRREGRG
ncbi:MAG: hypothetical protein KC619_03790 [Myxococcales bacterium]|nr:hypothetical protein [Myxococcales bacterium]